MNEKTVGIVGNGVVGSATGKAFERRGYTVRYWDLCPTRSTHSLLRVLQTGTVFVCLPTPSYVDGSSDVTSLLGFFTLPDVYDSKPRTTFVIRSTVPIGFTKDIHLNYHFPNIYHWPEFLTMRTAEQDAIAPRCILLGKAGGWAVGDWEETSPDHRLYLMLDEVFGGPHISPYTHDSSCTEAAKLFTNAFFAAKVSIFNEFRMLSDKLGLEWEHVRDMMINDQRISEHHTLVPGPDGQRGFGGACLPKDLESVIRQCVNAGISPHTLNGAAVTNGKVRPKV